MSTHLADHLASPGAAGDDLPGLPGAPSLGTVSAAATPGRAARARWERPALVGLLALTAVL